jgi:hypothetical protein
MAYGFNFCVVCGNKLQHVFGQDKDATTDSISFDWSFIDDKPHKKYIPNIKSPWSKDGNIDETEIYAEMTPSTDKSRTMNFIDELKVEKIDQKFVDKAAPLAESQMQRAGYQMAAALNAIFGK